MPVDVLFVGAGPASLAGALHLSNLDRPAAFSDAVRRFARSIVDA